MWLTLVSLFLTTPPLARAWEATEELIIPDFSDFNTTVRHYVFSVEAKLSMSVERDHKKYFIIDYNPDTEEWEERENDQLKPCLAKRTIARGPNPLNQSFFRGRDDFDSLAQFNGQHVRLNAVNGMLPGPLVVANKDTRIRITVKNNLKLDALTMIVYDLDTDWFNGGVPYLQQCPIAPRSEFTYVLDLNRIGTHLYRSANPHFQPDGFAGLLVSKIPNEILRTLDMDITNIATEYQLAIQDFPIQHADQSRPFGQFDGLAKWAKGMDRDDKTCSASGRFEGHVDKDEVAPAVIMINYKGWHSQEDLLKRPGKLPLTTFKVKQGGNNLFRIGHIGFEYAVRVSVEDHQMLVVINDGAHMRPIAAETLVFYPGKVFNFYFVGKTSPAKKVYRMVFETLERFGAAQTPIYGLANLEYDGVELGAQDLNLVDVSHAACERSGADCVAVNCADAYVHALRHYRCVHAADFRFYDARPADDHMLQSRAYAAADFEEHFVSMSAATGVDGFSYEPPRAIPYFDARVPSCRHRPCDRSKVARGRTRCRCFHYKELGYNKIVQFTIYNMGPTRDGVPNKPLPVHIPSTHFYLINVGFPSHHANGTVSKFNPDLVCENPEEGCFDARWRNASWARGNVPMRHAEPPLMSNVVVPFGGYVTLRFRTRKAGWWLVEGMRWSARRAGLAFAIKVGRRAEMPAPPPHFPRDCAPFEPPQIPDHVKSKISQM